MIDDVLLWCHPVEYKQSFFNIRISFALEEMFFIPITGPSAALENTRFYLIFKPKGGDIYMLKEAKVSEMWMSFAKDS